MGKKIPPLRSDEEAERFVETADLSEYDLSEFKPARFEFEEPHMGTVFRVALYGPDKDAKKARSLFHEESKKGFIGEPYERVMAYYYRGLLYWRDGEPDVASIDALIANLADLNKKAAAGGK